MERPDGLATHVWPRGIDPGGSATGLSRPPGAGHFDYLDRHGVHRICDAAAGILNRRERNFERELGVAALTDDAAMMPSQCRGESIANVLRQFEFENLSTAEAAQ